MQKKKNKNPLSKLCYHFINMTVSYIVKLATDETVITNNDQG